MTQLTSNPTFNEKSINLLVGGTPCQSFSVAGLRGGLADPRGNLMLTFLALADAKKPKWIVWENVPGVLSSNGGRDFATFLTALGNIGYGFAYRVLDAQYFGVAQRRRRVFVVGYLGDWRPAAAVLFESESLSGNPKPSRAKRQETSNDAQGSLGATGIPNIIGSLDTECGGGKLTHQSVNNGHLIPSWWNGEQTAATLTKQNAGGNQRMPDKDNFGAVIEQVAQPKYFESHPNDSRVTGPHDVGNTVSARYGTGGGNTPLVSQPIPIHDQATRFQGKRGDKQDGKGNGLGIGNEGDVMNTLTKADKHAVAQPISWDSEVNCNVNKMGTIVRGGQGGRTDGVAQPIAYSFDSLASNSMKSSNPNSGCREVETSKTIDTTTPEPSKNQGGIAIAQPIAVDTYNYTTNEKTTQTIRSQNDTEHIGAVMQPTIIDRAAFNQGQNAQYEPRIEEGQTMSSLVAKGPHAVQHTMAIRRLTPIECEKLQGFPSNWTKIPYRNKPADQCPDGPRYKACGNSMAVPVMRWIGQRIEYVESLMKDL